jgi:hypothetical protein
VNRGRPSPLAARLREQLHHVGLQSKRGRHPKGGQLRCIRQG